MLFMITFMFLIKSAYVKEAPCRDTFGNCDKHKERYRCCLGFMKRYCKKSCNWCPDYTIRVHGGYTQWSEWHRCSSSCGGGIQIRTRLCSNPIPRNGGMTCVQQNLGDSVEIIDCNMHGCPGALK